MKRILILGSEGQVGAYLKEYLDKKGYKILDFDIANGTHQDLSLIHI